MTEPVAEVAAESSRASHKTEYSERMRERQTSAAQLQRKHLWLGNVRIAVFVAILIQCWITRQDWLSVSLLAASSHRFIRCPRGRTPSHSDCAQYGEASGFCL